jgi:hypothetical protein
MGGGIIATSICSVSIAVYGWKEILKDLCCSEWNIFF